MYSQLLSRAALQLLLPSTRSHFWPHARSMRQGRHYGVEGTVNRVTVIRHFEKQHLNQDEVLVLLTEDRASRPDKYQIVIPPNANSAICGVEEFRERVVLRCLARWFGVPVPVPVLKAHDISRMLLNRCGKNMQDGHNDALPAHEPLSVSPKAVIRFYVYNDLGEVDCFAGAA